MNRIAVHISLLCKLLPVLMLVAACSNSDPGTEEELFGASGHGVFVLCEGNFNAGNATLSYYDPETRIVENAVFQRANDRRLGDTGQSITLRGGTAYIAVENSGIIWAIDTETFRVSGQLTTGQTEHMMNPRYIHFLTDGKAYVTDLYSPFITVFNPQTMTYIASISTEQPMAFGYSSTEQMVQHGQEVFTNCWSYSNKLLVIDTQRDALSDSIVLTSWQPKSLVLDARGKLWVVTDGGYETSEDSFSDNIPHLYRIDATTHQIELDQTLDTDEGGVQLATSPDGTVLYLINNDVYRMSITDSHLPVRPFIQAERNARGLRNKLYGIGVNPRNGEIYVADAVDYAQAGVVRRYSPEGTFLDLFRVGINPNGFAFK
jgi:DNA-binding beta-propeller fold protein YncE